VKEILKETKQGEIFE